jgi:hypothetical protein
MPHRAGRILTGTARAGTPEGSARGLAGPAEGGGAQRCAPLASGYRPSAPPLHLGPGTGPRVGPAGPGRGPFTTSRSTQNLPTTAPFLVRASGGIRKTCLFCRLASLGKVGVLGKFSWMAIACHDRMRGWTPTNCLLIRSLARGCEP